MSATQEEIRNGLAEIVNEITGVPAEDVQPDRSFAEDLDADSLAMVEIMVAVEERLGVAIPDDVATGMKTVGEAIGYILANRAPSAV